VAAGGGAAVDARRPTVRREAELPLVWWRYRLDKLSLGTRREIRTRRGAAHSEPSAEDNGRAKLEASIAHHGSEARRYGASNKFSDILALEVQNEWCRGATATLVSIWRAP